MRWQNRHSSPLIDSGTPLPAWSEPHAAGSSSPRGSAAGLGSVPSAKHAAVTPHANTDRDPARQRTPEAGRTVPPNAPSPRPSPPRRGRGRVVVSAAAVAFLPLPIGWGEGRGGGSAVV